MSDIIRIPRGFRGTIVFHADDAPRFRHLLCAASPCGTATYDGRTVVVHDPNLPAVHVPATGPEAVSER